MINPIAIVYERIPALDQFVPRSTVESLDALHWIGVLAVLLVVLRTVLPILGTFYQVFLRSGKNLRRYGEWAVVTGATDGIGKAFAFELARQGLNIVLVSRTAAKLAEVEKELNAKYPKIRVRQVPIDFSRFDEAAQFQLKTSIKDLNIGVLINNVGQSYGHPEYFHELDANTVQQLIDLNIKSTALVTHTVLPKMVEQRKGAIVNISSFASLVNSAFLSEYSAAKAFVDRFSESLNLEYANKGIHVQTQHPLFVTTKLAKIRKPSLFIPTPNGYARAACKYIGYESSVVPYWAHRLQVWLSTEVFPTWMLNKYIVSSHLGLRKRALKKKEQEQKKQ